VNERYCREWSNAGAIAALCGRSEKKIDFYSEHVLHLISNAKKLINVHNVSLYTNEAENIVAFLCAAMSTDGCSPFTNYLSPPVRPDLSPSQSSPACIVS